MNGPPLIPALVWLFLLGCGPSTADKDRKNGQIPQKSDTEFSRPVYNFEAYGRASFYANSLHGRPTASGSPYDKEALTAAHRSLPFGTCVKVTNLRNDSTVEVEITDRGPFHPRRIIDLSRAAARRIRLLQAGTAPVKLEAYLDSTEVNLP